MGRAKKYKQRSVSGVLPDVVKEKGWQVKLDMHSFFPRWHKVVDARVSECSRPLKIVKDVLWLEVENSTWMQQLQYEKMQILDDINATLQLSRIRDIKFLLPKEEVVAPQYELPPVSFTTPDPEKVASFENQISVIKDEAIRESLMRLWYLSQACRRDKKK